MNKQFFVSFLILALIGQPVFATPFDFTSLVYLTSAFAGALLFGILSSISYSAFLSKQQKSEAYRNTLLVLVIIISAVIIAFDLLIYLWISSDGYHSHSGDEAMYETIAILLFFAILPIILAQMVVQQPESKITRFFIHLLSLCAISPVLASIFFGLSFLITPFIS